MKNVDIKIDPGDLTRLNNKISVLRKEAPKKLSTNIAHSVKFMENDAVKNAPRDNGDLIRSIGSEVVGMTAEVFANVKYAPYQEFGTGSLVDVSEAESLGIPGATIKRLYKGKGKRKINIPPQPFFFPAVRKGLKKLLDGIEKDLKELL